MKTLFLIMLILTSGFFIVCGGILIQFDDGWLGILLLLIGLGIIIIPILRPGKKSASSKEKKNLTKKKTPLDESNENFSNFKGL